MSYNSSLHWVLRQVAFFFQISFSAKQTSLHKHGLATQEGIFGIVGKAVGKIRSRRHSIRVIYITVRIPKQILRLGHCFCIISDSRSISKKRKCKIHVVLNAFAFFFSLEIRKPTNYSTPPWTVFREIKKKP